MFLYLSPLGKQRSLLSHQRAPPTTPPSLLRNGAWALKPKEWIPAPFYPPRNSSSHLFSMDQRKKERKKMWLVYRILLLQQRQLTPLPSISSQSHLHPNAPKCTRVSFSFAPSKDTPGGPTFACICQVKLSCDIPSLSSLIWDFIALVASSTSTYNLE